MALRSEKGTAAQPLHRSTIYPTPLSLCTGPTHKAQLHNAHIP